MYAQISAISERQTIEGMGTVPCDSCILQMLVCSYLLFLWCLGMMHISIFQSLVSELSASELPQYFLQNIISEASSWAHWIRNSGGPNNALRKTLFVKEFCRLYGIAHFVTYWISIDDIEWRVRKLISIEFLSPSEIEESNEEGFLSRSIREQAELDSWVLALLQERK